MNIPKALCLFLMLSVVGLTAWGQTNLSERGSANSYLVTKSGRYVIDCTRMGEDGDRLEDVSSAVLLWSDPADLVDELAYREGKAFFTVSEGEGKASIAVVDKNGKYLWSWLIWKRLSTPYDILCVNHTFGCYVLLDSFLGETPGTSPAFFRWGDARAFPSEAVVTPEASPSFQADAWGDGEGYYKRYEAGGWSGEKSSRDPCPKGYRVANSHTFSGFTMWGGNTTRSYEMNMHGSNCEGFWFSKRRGDEDGLYFMSYCPTGNRVWCSNPFHLHKETGACIFYGENEVKVLDYDDPGQLHPVRCVLIDDTQTVSGKDVEAAWKSPVQQDYDQGYTDLSAAGHANSYIIPGPGNYCFDARYKGNSRKKTGKATCAELLWTDVPCMIANVRLDGKGFICFSVHKKAGNALIAAKDDKGVILWSWHMWMPGEEVHTLEWYNNKNFVSCIMDRNLGALPGKNLECMLYQWGRKDPFPNTNRAFVGENTIAQQRFTDVFPPVACSQTGDEAHNNMDYAVRNPCTIVRSDNDAGTWFPYTDSEIPYLWGDPKGFVAEFREAGKWSDEKSVNDPCPPGYRVSNSGSFTGMTKTGGATEEKRQFRVEGPCESGWNVKTSEKDYQTIWFPLSGWIISSTGMMAAVDSRGALWHSNPTGTDMKKMRRTMYHHNLFLPESSDTAASGYAIRCVKE